MGTALYSPYGKLLQSEGVQANMAYAGLYHHQESGLYLATYRGYNPFTARWLNRDPIEENGGLNLYEYVGGDPISYIDPTGEVGLPGAAIGGLVGGISAFTGALSTGSSIKNAAISGGVGLVIGAGAGFFGQVGALGSIALGGGGSALGQYISNNLDDDPCNDMNINFGSVIGSAIGGGWASAITKGAGPISGAVIGWGPSVSSEAIGAEIGK